MINSYEPKIVSLAIKNITSSFIGVSFLFLCRKN